MIRLTLKGILLYFRYYCLLPPPFLIFPSQPISRKEKMSTKKVVYFVIKITRILSLVKVRKNVCFNNYSPIPSYSHCIRKSVKTASLSVPLPLIDYGLTILRDSAPCYTFYSIRPHTAYLRKPFGQPFCQLSFVYRFISQFYLQNELIPPP